MSAAAKSADKLPPGPIEWLGRFLWRALNSLPVAIWVMLALAVLSAIGTVIPQEHIAQPPQGQTHDEMYAQRFGPALWHTLELGTLTLKLPASRLALIEFLGLTKIYFTWYFFGLFCWLCISAAVCNVVRIKRTVRLWKEPPYKRSRGYFKAEKRSLLLPASAAQYSAALDELRRRGYRVAEGEFSGGQSAYADKGFANKWWMIVLHVAILVLLGGGIYGKSLGAQGLIDLADGETKTLTLDLAEGKHQLVRPLLEKLPHMDFELRQGAFRIDWEKRIVMPSYLDGASEAELEYERYFVDDYVSTLTAKSLRNGQEKSQEVEVNHPLVVDKLQLFQSSYVQVGYLSITQGSITREQEFPPQQWLVLTPSGLAPVQQAIASGMPISDRVLYFEPVKGGQLYTKKEVSGEFGPLTLVRMADARTGDELPAQIIDTERGLSLNVGGRPAELKVAERLDNISVFSWKRDPGMPVLYLGWVLMILGVGFALYTPFTQVWLRHDSEGACLLLLGRGSQKSSPLMRRLHAILAGPVGEQTGS